MGRRTEEAFLSVTHISIFVSDCKTRFTSTNREKILDKAEVIGFIAVMTVRQDRQRKRNNESGGERKRERDIHAYIGGERKNKRERK